MDLTAWLNTIHLMVVSDLGWGNNIKGKYIIRQRIQNYND